MHAYNVTCPLCGALLQRLTGHDGYHVVPVAPAFGLACERVHERLELGTIYTCPACEYVQRGIVEVSHG